MASHLMTDLRQLLAIKLLIISAASVLAPIFSEKIKWVFIPSIVFELVCGVIIGPHVLNWVQPLPQIDALAMIGLTLLIFLVGFEIDVQHMRGRMLLLATVCWLTALLTAFVLTQGMLEVGLVTEVTLVALALSTTALGALLPMLQDTHVTRSKFKTLVLAVGSVGQFAPILLMSLLFTTASLATTSLLLVAFIVIAMVVAWSFATLYQLKTFQFVRDHFHLSSQLPVRVSVFLIFLLVVLAIQFKLNVLLGAFAAGMVLRRFTAAQDRMLIDGKLKALGYSFMIPLFFIVSGMHVDIQAFATFSTVGRMLFFFVCLLLVRILPIFVLLRGELSFKEREALTCFSATTLPLIVVITHLGVMTGKLLPANAVALVGAGVLSIIVFPVLGLKQLEA
ncbi:MAG: cation:proton antiporter [Legionellaceae bacterium]|nr:cation:proton antiporter [Legionellaceae bacterium]